MSADMKRQCPKCFKAGIQDIAGDTPYVYWTFTKKGYYEMRCNCVVCGDPLGKVGPRSPLAKLAPPKPPDRKTLFDKSPYLVKGKDD